MDTNATALDLISLINRVRLDPSDEGFDELILLVASLIEPGAPSPKRRKVLVRDTPTPERPPNSLFHPDEDTPRPLLGLSPVEK